MGDLIFLIDRQSVKCECGKRLTSDNAFVINNRYSCSPYGCPVILIRKAAGKILEGEDGKDAS
jgi:hypothetical protein